MISNQASYNAIADQWEEARVKAIVSKVIVEFSEKLKINDKILDIGCGTGEPISKYLSDCGFNITGIDISEKLIQKAIAKTIKNSTFLLSDFFDFDPKEKFDGIIAYDSFFHFPKDKQSRIYSRVSSWMNEGAYLLFTHGHKESEITGEMFNQTFYYSCLDTERVHQLLIESGFSILSSIEKFEELDTNQNKMIERDLVILAQKIR
jgi:cyclopropane fatty-acyl-phospholipid synthase-like methyltransferase